MSHGLNAKRRNGKQWWGKRPMNYHETSLNAGVNKFFKKLLHKKERKIGKNSTEI